MWPAITIARPAEGSNSRPVLGISNLFTSAAQAAALEPHPEAERHRPWLDPPAEAVPLTPSVRSRTSRRARHQTDALLAAGPRDRFVFVAALEAVALDWRVVRYLLLFTADGSVRSL